MTRTCIRIVIGFGVFLFVLPAGADMNPAPSVVAIDFQSMEAIPDLAIMAEGTSCIQAMHQSNGHFDAVGGAWVAAADLPFGQGSLILGLNRDVIAADLALTLIYEETSNGDFVVQLWDAQNQILAADLFSNIIVAGREAKTDTFILDLARYPTATQVVLRRLTGDVRIYGLIFSPVACEVPLEGCDAFELALQLDQGITAESEWVQAAEQIVQPQGRTVNWTDRTVQQPLDVTAHNPYALTAFAAEDYPAYVPTATVLDGERQLKFTASSLYGVLEMLRLLNAYHPQTQYTARRSLSSEQALQPFLAGQTKMCIMSIPMSLADRERFFRERGYPVLEFPAAIDPILVIVNKDNPIDELTIPQLDAIFGTELRAGAEARIETWGDLGVDRSWAEQPIVLWGGSLQTGTSRLFQELALQGGPFDPGLQNDLYRMYIGVTHAIASDPTAIGYLNAQNCNLRVKPLALAPQTGLPAYPPTSEHVYADRYPLTRALYLYLDAADPRQIDPLTRELLNLLYSRSGQEFFARSMQAPLPADQVRDIRARLGL